MTENNSVGKVFDDSRLHRFDLLAVFIMCAKLSCHIPLRWQRNQDTNIFIFKELLVSETLYNIEKGFFLEGS